MGGQIDRRPGATTRVAQAGGGAAPAAPAVGPGRSSLTSGPLPKTTADLGPVRVTADRLNVRSAPQIEPGNVLGGLEHGQVVEAIERDGDWVRIAFGTKDAYVSGTFVEPAPPPDAAAPGSAPPGADAAIASPSPDSSVAAPAAPITPPSAPASVVFAPPQPSFLSPLPPPSPWMPGSIFALQVPGKGEFATASGNVVAKTTPAEAAVLNQIRSDPRRLDPAWLTVAQRNLGVVDATGAMNTETLRAMREHAHQPRLDAAGILTEAFLVPLAPGKPFHDGVETGENRDKQEADPAATTIKDRAAQNLGYANFRAYRATWGNDPVLFLGVSLENPVHPYLRARLRVAETYLRNRVKSPSGQPLNDDGVRKAIGWNGEASTSYAAEVDANMQYVHPHAMGIAIDIDPGQNPFFYDLSAPEPAFWFEYLEHLFQHATKLYGGDVLTAKSMLAMSQQMSTEELYQHIRASSQAFGKLLELSARAQKDDSPTGEIATSLARVGYTGADLTTATHEVAMANEDFHKQKSRKDAKQATNQSQELVIALRDAAGLSWGGTEMSPVEGGDFMHWDCRNTDFGRAVLAAGAAAKKADAEAKKAKKK
jgi:hypothetical protein